MIVSDSGETRINLIVGVVVGSVVLFSALKFGFIGGGGAVSRRDTNPIPFWIGVAVTGFGLAVAIILLVLAAVGVVRL
jgi:hypothetical protein